MNRRIKYLFRIIISIILGLLSRYFWDEFPMWINKYLGDILYALMFYNIFSFVFIEVDKKYILFISTIYCLSIELSQIYQGDWIDSIRKTTLGHLLLGRGFLFSDIISYTLGNIIGYKIDKRLLIE